MPKHITQNSALHETSPLANPGHSTLRAQDNRPTLSQLKCRIDCLIQFCQLVLGYTFLIDGCNLQSYVHAQDIQRWCLAGKCVILTTAPLSSLCVGSVKTCPSSSSTSCLVRLWLFQMYATISSALNMKRQRHFISQKELLRVRVETLLCAISICSHVSRIAVTRKYSPGCRAVSWRIHK